MRKKEWNVIDIVLDLKIHNRKRLKEERRFKGYGYVRYNRWRYRKNYR